MKFDIKALAREAGIKIHDGVTPWFTGPEDAETLRRFATAVHRATLEGAAQKLAAMRDEIPNESVTQLKMRSTLKQAEKEMCALAQEPLECQKR